MYIYIITEVTEDHLTAVLILNRTAVVQITSLYFNMLTCMYVQYLYLLLEVYTVTLHKAWPCTFSDRSVLQLLFYLAMPLVWNQVDFVYLKLLVGKFGGGKVCLIDSFLAFVKESLAD